MRRALIIAYDPPAIIQLGVNALTVGLSFLKSLNWNRLLLLAIGMKIFKALSAMLNLRKMRNSKMNAIILISYPKLMTLKSLGTIDRIVQSDNFDFVLYKDFKF